MVTREGASAKPTIRRLEPGETITGRSAIYCIKRASGESVTKPINHLDITQIEQVNNHSKTEMDFNHLGMEEESDFDNETPSELEKMISEFEDKRKPNLEEDNIINVGTVENP